MANGMTSKGARGKNGLRRLSDTRRNGLLPQRDPDLQYSTLLPFAKHTETGEVEWAWPEVARELADAFTLPGRVYQGEPYSARDVTEMALEVGMLGSIGSAPGGALTSGIARRKAGVMVGPELNRRQFDDLAAPAKKRKKWAGDRKAEQRANQEAVRTAQEERRAARSGLDPLRAYGGGRNRLDAKLRDKRANQAIMDVADEFGIDPERLSGRVYRDHQEIRTKAQRLASGDRKLEMARQAVDAGYWRKDFADEVVRDIEIGLPAQEAINRANLEAVPRLLKKAGWSTRHASKGGSGRKSSRYLVSPDGRFEIRLSDHELPDTPMRQFSREQRGARWDDEIVLTGHESPQELLGEVQRRYKATTQGK